MKNLRMVRAQRARYNALLRQANAPQRRPQLSAPLQGPGLGWGFVGQGATLFNTIVPLSLVALLGYGVYRWGYYALKGRSVPAYTGIPHASKVWD
jgi:hypothetical protein